MRRKRLLAGGVLTAAIVAASTAVSWSQPVPPSGETRLADPGNVVGLAGPAGPQQISPVAAYFRRATFTGRELRQFHEIGAQPPAGRYLVEVSAPGSIDAVDCMGVSFPLVPPHDATPDYTGYATVAKSGDDVTVSCFEEPATPDAVVTYELYLIPVAGA
jgi:hypothetical protein